MGPSAEHLMGSLRGLAVHNPRGGVGELSPLKNLKGVWGYEVPPTGM